MKTAKKKNETKTKTHRKKKIGLNSKTKTTLHVRVQHNFRAISLPLFCTTTTWNFQKRPSYTFCGGNVVFVSDRFFFSLPLIFTFEAASISHFLTAAIKFSCFWRNWSLVFFISRSSSCSVIHANEGTKIYAKERLVSVIVVVVFFLLSLKVRVARRFIAQTRRGFKCEFLPRLAWRGGRT